MPTRSSTNPDVWIYTDAERAREQQCPHAKDCACDHLLCHDGWMIQHVDDDGPARRCPHCYDAALMAAERLEAERSAASRGRRGKGGWPG